MTGNIVGQTDYSIAPRSAFRFSTSGAGTAITTGAMRIVPNGTAAAGLVIFSYRANNITVTEASVPASISSSAFRMYAEPQSGIALTNTGASATTVTFELTNLRGDTAGATTATIAADGHLAFFLNELQPFAALPSGFQGVLRVTGNSISVVGLRGRYNERGEFLITTTPAASESLPIPFHSIRSHRSHIPACCRRWGLHNASDLVFRGQRYFVRISGVLLEAMNAQAETRSRKRTAIFERISSRQGRLLA